MLRQLGETVRAQVAQAGAATRAGCAYRGDAVGCRDLHGWHSSGAVLCPDSPISECTAAAGCRLSWLLLNRVQRPVQDAWQGETRLRFKLRGLSAPPCAQCCARTRVRCTRLSIPACDENLHEMCELPNYGRVLVATGVMALWRRSGDGRALMTHALLAMERRTIHSCFPIGRQESR